jgi:hypothetical protein
MRVVHAGFAWLSALAEGEQRLAPLVKTLALVTQNMGRADWPGAGRDLVGCVAWRLALVGRDKRVCSHCERTQRDAAAGLGSVLLGRFAGCSS